MKRSMIAISMGLMAFAMAARAESAHVPDQTVATWTEQNGDARIEHTLSIANGTLTSMSVLYDKLYPKGDKSIESVKLARIKRIGGDMLTNADMAKMEPDRTDTSDTPAVYRIGVYAKGGKDIVDSSFDGKLVHHTGGMPGFASFPVDQKDAVAAAYKKLCALMDKGICD